MEKLAGKTLTDIEVHDLSCAETLCTHDLIPPLWDLEAPIGGYVAKVIERRWIPLPTTGLQQSDGADWQSREIARARWLRGAREYSHSLYGVPHRNRTGPAEDDRPRPGSDPVGGGLLESSNGHSKPRAGTSAPAARGTKNQSMRARSHLWQERLRRTTGTRPMTHVSHHYQFIHDSREPSLPQARSAATARARMNIRTSSGPLNRLSARKARSIDYGTPKYPTAVHEPGPKRAYKNRTANHALPPAPCPLNMLNAD
jgi:hypothetical protein